MVRKGYLKRIVVKQPFLNQSDTKLVNKHDFLVLNKQTVSLGRSKKCDLVLNPKIISRKHVVFEFVDNQWTLKCLNEKNGVFVNGKLLKLGEIKKLEDNYIISFGPNFATDFIYQFTTKQDNNHNYDIISKSDSICQADSSSSSVKLNMNSHSDKNSINSQSKATNSLVLSALSSINKQNTKIVNQKRVRSSMEAFDSLINEEKLSSNERKIKDLKERIKYLSNKVDKLKQKKRDSRIQMKKMNKKIAFYHRANITQKQLLRNAKSSLNRERLKKKKLMKKLIDNEKIKDETNVVESNSVSQDERTEKIVKKYNELFSDDLICGVCLELYVEPVSATCGHSFCNFCLSQWLKRNPSRKFDCPLCRTSCKGYFKNMVIENIIDKYLNTADNQILAVRERLIEERNKVIEASKKDPNMEAHNRRIRQLNLNEFNGNSLIEVLNDGRSQFMFNPFDDGFTSNDDDELAGNLDFDFDEFEDDEYISEVDDDFDDDDGPFDIVIQD